MASAWGYVFLDPAECLDPVDAGEADIEENEVGIFLFCELDTLFAVHGEEDLVRLGRQNLFEHGPNRLIVVHTEDFWSH